MPAEPLYLPRPLVNRLLREAQRAGEFSQGWILRDARGQLQSMPLPPDLDLGTVAARPPNGRGFAFYRSATMSATQLTTEETAALGQYTAIFLDIALDTKGVLQLRAWCIAANSLVATAVSVTESPAAAQ